MRNVVKTSGFTRQRRYLTAPYLHGPVIVGKDAEVRHCAFIRGSAPDGEGAVVGNSTELKNVILFDKDTGTAL